ncbi:MAG: hypothetical protein OEW24_05975 [Chloroflexota bacterium]|nr:hypothetical protein [Chloroflexota bacterium]
MNARTPTSALAAIAVALAFSSLAIPAPVVAADPPARFQTDAEQRDDGSWMLRATLTRAGAVQSQQTVEFLQKVDFFGERWISLGSAVTDSAGVAARLYSPTSNGLQHLVARLAAGDGTFDSDVFDITVSGAVPAIPEGEPNLPIIKMWAFPVGAALLFLVWLALAVIFFRAVIGIARPTRAQATGHAPTREGQAESSPPTRP